MDVENGQFDNKPMSESTDPEMNFILNQGLIACVKEMPILWNEVHFPAADRVELELIKFWSAVAADLGLSVTDAQVRWNELRDGYVAARQFVNASKASEGKNCSEHENQVMTNFPYYDLMNFLDDYLDQIESSKVSKKSEHPAVSGSIQGSDHLRLMIHNKSPASFEKDVLDFLRRNDESGQTGALNNENCKYPEEYFINHYKDNTDSDQSDLRDFLLSVQDSIMQVPKEHRMGVQKETLQFLESKLQNFKS